MFFAKDQSFTWTAIIGQGDLSRWGRPLVGRKMSAPVVPRGAAVIILNNIIWSLYGGYLMLRSSVCIHIRANSTGPKGFAHPRSRASRIAEGRDILLRRQACIAASWPLSRLRRTRYRSNPLIPLLGNPTDSFPHSCKGVMGCCTE